jgi:hypothetical protein
MSADALADWVEDEIYPIFGFTEDIEEREQFVRSLSHFWSPDSEQFVQQKLADRAQYNIDLQTHYETTKPSKLATEILFPL